VLDIYDTQARAIVASRNIGKPAPAPDGTCTVDINALVTGLPPGDYHAVALADYRTSVSASFAERLAPQATRVTLREGQPATVSLVVRNPE